MKGKHLAALTIALIASSHAAAGTYEWTQGWGMGVFEYSVDDGNANSMIISCPSEGFISADATINGHSYFSSESSGFDVIADGVQFSNPFYTDCRVCDANFRAVFWDAFRNANNLKLTADGQVINLPTKNLRELLSPLDDSTNACHSAW